MRAIWQSPDPSQTPAVALLSQVFETLVRIDERGEIQPWLATSWTHDAVAKRWVFVPRTGVTLHNGSPWTPPGGAISVSDGKPIEQILRDLAKPANAIVVRDADGTLLGTGPFRIVRWEPGKTARLEAHDAYWRGRPFLDAVEIQMGRGIREQLLDLELAKTDVAEAAVTDVRRLRQRGIEVQISKPSDTLALVFENSRVPQATREALALGIDRGAMQRVLLDRQGEVSAALLPQWLSGYAFLFPVVRDLARGRTLAHDQRPLRFVCDRDDALLRSLAERIAVDAGEAGITLSLVSGSTDVRLRRLPLMSMDAGLALEDFAAILGVPSPHGSSPYETERQLLGDFRVIPLFHLPAVYALGKNVRNWTPGWRLDDVWLEPR
jgi:MarR-like DNA-binding transcriptional regulator SgrR of sgrS sRNA